MYGSTLLFLLPYLAAVSYPYNYHLMPVNLRRYLIFHLHTQMEELPEVLSTSTIPGLLCPYMYSDALLLQE